MDFDRQERLQGGARTVMPLRRPPLKEQGLETLADAVRVKVTYVIYESRVSHEAMKTSATKIREILVRNKTRDNSLGNFRTAKLQSMVSLMLVTAATVFKYFGWCWRISWKIVRASSTRALD